MKENCAAGGELIAFLPIFVADSDCSANGWYRDPRGPPKRQVVRV